MSAKHPHSASSNRLLMSRSNTNLLNNNRDSSARIPFIRDPSTISTDNIKFAKVLDDNKNVGEETLYQIDIVNENLLRKSYRSELASKNLLLTRRWQTAAVSSFIVIALAASIGGLAYWISIPKVITQPFLLYGASCYMDSRSCDATRLLWCPAGTCVCTGNYQWNSTAQNCSCVQYQIWNGLECEDYGSYGDPCSRSLPCLPTLSCMTVINQTYTTGQEICDCDNVTYLDTVNTSSTYGQCISRVSYGAVCLTEDDCQNWVGLSCTGSTTGGSATCLCTSTSYWNGSKCVEQAQGGQPCSLTVPCETSIGLSCVNNTCQCNQYDYWDNITTFTCVAKKTYGDPCNYNFQCNTTVNLSCPSVATGCSCPISSIPHICDCQAGEFWDGQQCDTQHSFNGTCPGQYACSSNLVCYLGHCICPGNMVWGNTTANSCACPLGTTWTTTINTCQ